MYVGLKCQSMEMRLEKEAGMSSPVHEAWH